ncbi:MAG: diguanylate cyclase [Desulfobulbus sp.]|nr:diguanylate cyclase [Desulfobulbus sp.]
MSIRLKVFVIILFLFALLGGADFLIQRFIIFPSFLELEYREAGENLRRIFYAIDREVVHLDRLCHDWAVWDDSYAFMQKQSPQFMASNLNEATLTSDHLNLLLFCRLDGTIIWASGTQNGKELAFPFLHTKALPQRHPLLTHLPSNGTKSTSGIIDTPFGPLLFSTQTILRSDGSGPDKGFLVMGRLFDQEILQTLKEQTRILFEMLYPVPSEAGVCGSIEQGIPHRQERLNFFELNNGKFIKSCAGYPDITGKPLFGIQYLFPREITRKGIASMGYAAALVIASGLIIVCILNLILQQVILRPIQQLTDHALAIEQEKDFSRRIDMAREDEIGKLAHSLDTMVQTIDVQTSELQLANEQLIILSVQDGLTGIANRRMFDRYLNKEWRRAMREQVPLALILLDVDFFKKYNDTYGHQQGDRCLIAVAETMQKIIRRPADLAARYGGEEFAIILPNTHQEGAMLIAERVREGLQTLEIPHSGSDVSAHVSISLGVATTVPQANTDVTVAIDTFVETADRGLYQAKLQGRNRTVCAEFPVQETS